ncbi:MAG: cyclic nucleotide-binding domain-containing protein [Anaerolineales bacterium]|nr:cyclic nucleotide-binding domain-containing protein [Anaerolineales bacterium]
MLDTPMVKNKQTSRLEVLRKFASLAPFSAECLQALAKGSVHFSAKPNQVIFRQGEVSESMYVILKGRIKFERDDHKNETINSGELAQYESFGEVSMLKREPRQSTVTAVTDAEFLVIERALLLEALGKSTPEEVADFFSALNDQTRKMYDAQLLEVLSKRSLSAQMEVEKQRALTQMVAGVAHEVNTPLGVINTAVAIMARELAVPAEMTAQRAADIAESLELIRRNVDRAHALVQDFKKVSVSQLVAEKEKLNISDVVSEIVGLMAVSLIKHGVSVKIVDKLKPEEKSWIGYRGFLSQVLINFLTNAERYAYPKGGGQATITLELEDQDRLRLTFADHGAGISKENQSHIFEPFFTTGRALGGTGLGLAIVHNLVTNSLKGEIKLKSQEGKGAEFTVILPRVIVE